MSKLSITAPPPLVFLIWTRFRMSTSWLSTTTHEIIPMSVNANNIEDSFGPFYAFYFVTIYIPFYCSISYVSEKLKIRYSEKSLVPCKTIAQVTSSACWNKVYNTLSLKYSRLCCLLSVARNFFRGADENIRSVYTTFKPLPMKNYCPRQWKR